MMQRIPHVPVSWGELLDKVTILAIKRDRLADAGARANVTREYQLLRDIGEEALAHDGVEPLVLQLRGVNEELWEIEDAIRLCEAAGDFGAEFVRLARAVYRTNDRRASIKREINLLLASGLIEEKSYAGELSAPAR